MSWSEQHAAQAAQEGWRLAPTVDNGKSHVYVMLAATPDGFKSDHEAGLHVVRRAREGSRLHQSALAAVMASRAQPHKRK